MRRFKKRCLDQNQMLLFTEGLEIHDEALVAAETKSIVEVVGVDIGIDIFIKRDVPTKEEVVEAGRRGSEMLPLRFFQQSVPSFSSIL